MTHNDECNQPDNCTDLYATPSSCLSWLVISVEKCVSSHTLKIQAAGIAINKRRQRNLTLLITSYKNDMTAQESSIISHSKVIVSLI